MISKLGFSLVAALTLFAAVARAAPDAEFSAAEAGTPDSVDYANRAPATHFPSDEEIEGLEVGNPDSVRSADRGSVSVEQVSQADWVALEFGNPDVP